MSDEQFNVTWRGTGRKAQCAPNPRYPDGIDLDVSNGAVSCKARVPYPAPECGTYIVECLGCGLRVAITAAGRPDDPRSVTMPCKAVADA